MRDYDVSVLTEAQRRRLNERKAIGRKENEAYLGRHPEIRGLISILLRHLLRTRPTLRIHEVAGEFFNRPRRQIAVDLLDYLSDADCPPERKNSLLGKLVLLINQPDPGEISETPRA